MFLLKLRIFYVKTPQLQSIQLQGDNVVKDTQRFLKQVVLSVRGTPIQFILKHNQKYKQCFSRLNPLKICFLIYKICNDRAE